MCLFRKKTRSRDDEREKIARLEEAEAHVRAVKERESRVVERLESRRGRNHWREAIQEMIQGV